MPSSSSRFQMLETGSPPALAPAGFDFGFFGKRHKEIIYHLSLDCFVLHPRFLRFEIAVGEHKGAVMTMFQDQSKRDPLSIEQSSPWRLFALFFSVCMVLGVLLAAFSN